MNTITKQSIFITLFLFLSIISKAQEAPMWMVDKAHTSVNFSINHFFSSVTGKFKVFDGEFNLDPNNLSKSKANFTVRVNSIDTDNLKRDKHLLSNDFFDANSYPDMIFKSTKITKKNNSEFLVYGKLSIKNKTKNIVLPITVKGEMEHPMMPGTIILGIATKISINRNDFGVGTGDWAATMVVGNKVDVEINMELNRKK